MFIGDGLREKVTPNPNERTSWAKLPLFDEMRPRSKAMYRINATCCVNVQSPYWTMGT